MPSAPAPAHPRRSTPLLTTTGNSKLGPRIRSWSLPAIHTCPGRGPTCTRLCYADRGHFLQANVKKLYDRNLEASRAPGFAAAMVHEIRRDGVRIVRIHVAGDYYSAAYTAAWVEIARRSPACRFYAYTRSWRDPAILPVLLDLAALPNVDLWWSEDRDTGPAPVVAGIRRCFLVHDATDAALVDRTRHELVFRDGAHRAVAVSGPGAVKRIGGVLVCPHEQRPQARGHTALDPAYRAPLSCSRCQICFSPPRPLSEIP